jgi:hypothetical protein
MKKMKKEEKSCCSEIGRHSPNIAVTSLLYPVDFRIVVGEDQDLWGNGYGSVTLQL